MSTFKTLLLREWLQHRRGWMVVVALPPLLMLGLLAFDQVQVRFDDTDSATALATLPGAALALMSIVAASTMCFVLAWGAALIQAPGLARRDQQDRSIEFWLSLPIGHAKALAAPLLAHQLLFPLAALGLGALAGLLIAPLAVARFTQAADLPGLPWGLILATSLALLARFALGFALALLWLSPLVLLVMAASAWLRRWGVPAVVAGALLLGGVLDRVLGHPMITDFGRALLDQALHAFVADIRRMTLNLGPGSDAVLALSAYPAAAAQDALLALGRLANPLLALVLLLSAAFFGLLVLRRRQGA